MLLALIQWLADSTSLGWLRVFNYLTLRAVLAALTAFFIALALGPAVIRELRKLKVGQAVRQYGPKSHLVKEGTPTMGGILILIAVGASTILWMDLSNRFVWVVLFVTLSFGAIGWVDDYRKVVHHDPEGMKSREKFFWQSLVGIASDRHLGLYRPQLLRDCGHEQRCEPHRRSGRLSHSAERFGRYRFGHLCLRGRPC